jgi:hypothetical protein
VRNFGQVSVGNVSIGAPDDMFTGQSLLDGMDDFDLEDRRVESRLNNTDSADREMDDFDLYEEDAQVRALAHCCCCCCCYCLFCPAARCPRSPWMQPPLVLDANVPMWHTSPEHYAASKQRPS